MRADIHLRMHNERTMTKETKTKNTPKQRREKAEGLKNTNGTTKDEHTQKRQLRMHGHAVTQRTRGVLRGHQTSQRNLSQYAMGCLEVIVDAAVQASLHD